MNRVREIVNEERRKTRAIKPGYPFIPGDPNALQEGKVLARAYKISFNKLLSLLLENAIEEWAVPYMQPRPRVGEEPTAPANEGVYPEKAIDKQPT